MLLSSAAQPDKPDDLARVNLGVEWASPVDDRLFEDKSRETLLPQWLPADLRWFAPDDQEDKFLWRRRRDTAFASDPPVT